MLLIANDTLPVWNLGFNLDQIVPIFPNPERRSYRAFNSSALTYSLNPFGVLIETRGNSSKIRGIVSGSGSAWIDAVLRAYCAIVRRRVEDRRFAKTLVSESLESGEPAIN